VGQEREKKSRASRKEGRLVKKGKFQEKQIKKRKVGLIQRAQYGSKGKHHSKRKRSGL